MKTGIAIAAVAAVAAIGFGAHMVDVDMTDEGSLPDVDVSVGSGSMPEFDVETGDIEVGSTELDVTVPTLEIEAPEEDGRLADSQ